MAYAATTTVPVERTRAEIERLLNKHRCTHFATGQDRLLHTAMVQFKASDRIVRFVLAMPYPLDKAFTHERTHTWKKRTAEATAKALAQAERQKWRALYLVIKAKLEAIESNISTFEEEFLAHIVLPDDRTVGDVILPLVAEAYETRRMPKRLTAGERVDAVGTEGGKVTVP